jgi:ribosome-binding protein aMBF1 (putative translation factor)
MVTAWPAGRPPYRQGVDLDRAATAHTHARAKVDEIKRTNAERLRAAREQVDSTRADLAAAIVRAYVHDGVHVGELAQRAQYSRETVRVILRAAGVEPD